MIFLRETPEGSRMDWTMSPEASYSDEEKMDRIYI